MPILWVASQLSAITGRMDPNVTSQLSAITGWHGLNNPWVPGDDAGVDYIYVDLRRNPEKYTGYKGEDARRVWAAIYDQSALKEAAAAVAAARTDSETAAVPREQEVLYRLISGMHTAITTSIVHNFHDEATGTWGPNLPMFKARFGHPAAKSFVENLYFTLLFVLRAVTKAGPALSTFGYNTGQPAADARTEELMRSLVSNDALRKACPAPFDEGMLWRREGSEVLASELQIAFHNITRVMDCVGCEKCKMHGKLNILGIASAMKVLFSVPPPPPGTSTTACADPHLILDRNEVIALINLLAKLSKSIEAIRELSLQLDQHPEL
ncbi:endoplasmic reticulum oxidoreductin 1 [Dunaliella salina]|uniref:Endoplasmic reticulum oxidoreductin 1 n=1 Tax=Dunaliella salina TaxID=3046 RepID=A0ABQ7GIG9_DUNSA|nr:endoplasmic reticulum oxidoreductin 1 [Dunaliella salina]|eukprot:KAF5834410.1 endoplasmic reticulum oxidoreductin 1 [Dunaliella salina]